VIPGARAAAVRQYRPPVVHAISDVTHASLTQFSFFFLLDFLIIT
jgi:hypothetical protein